jgi:hypothetical protein
VTVTDPPGPVDYSTADTNPNSSYTLPGGEVARPPLVRGIEFQPYQEGNPFTRFAVLMSMGGNTVAPTEGIYVVDGTCRLGCFFGPDFYYPTAGDELRAEFAVVVPAGTYWCYTCAGFKVDDETRFVYGPLHFFTVERNPYLP